MALVKCAECGHDVSTLAASCPNCGAPPPVASVATPATEVYAAKKPEASVGLKGRAARDVEHQTHGDAVERLVEKRVPLLVTVLVLASVPLVIAAAVCIYSPVAWDGVRDGVSRWLERKREEGKAQALRDKYRNPPQSLDAALRALKRVQARTEVGLNSMQYSDVLGEALAEVKAFTESADGERYAEAAEDCRSAMFYYQEAAREWQKTIRAGRNVDNNEMIRSYWSLAGTFIEMVNKLLNP